jgi:hypothetical protein
MSLTLYLHPLSSYCHKVLIALYESSIPFAQRVQESLALRPVSGPAGCDTVANRPRINHDHRVSDALLSWSGEVGSGRSGAGIAGARGGPLL